MQPRTLSIVVIINQAERAAERWLSYLRAQDMAGLEVILVNDAVVNPDLQAACAAFAKDNLAVTFIRNHKAIGVGRCRQLALEICNGKYVFFAVPGHESSPSRYSVLLDAAETHQADIVVADTDDSDVSGGEINSYENWQNRAAVEILTGSELFESQINQIRRPYSLGCGWANKLYKRSLFTKHGFAPAPVAGHVDSSAMMLSLLAGRCCILNRAYPPDRDDGPNGDSPPSPETTHDSTESARCIRWWLNETGLMEKYHDVYIRFFGYLVFVCNIQSILRLPKPEQPAMFGDLIHAIHQHSAIRADFYRYLNLKDKWLARLLYATAISKSYSPAILSQANNLECFDRTGGDRRFEYHNGLLKKPEVTIITICRNILDTGRKALFEKMLNSVADQTFDRKNIEHIVIDGASTDGTTEYLHHLHSAERLDYWISEPDTGIYNAMNKGVMHARGQYILFLNTDDRLFETGISRLMDSAHATGADYVYGDALLINPSGKKVGSLRGRIDKVYFGTPYCHQALLCGRYCFADSWFDENYEITMWSHSLKLHMNGYRSDHVRGYIAYYRQGGVSTADAGKIKLFEEKMRIINTIIVPRLPISCDEYELLNCVIRGRSTDDFNLEPAVVVEKLDHSRSPFATDFLRAYKRLVA